MIIIYDLDGDVGNMFDLIIRNLHIHNNSLLLSLKPRAKSVTRGQNIKTLRRIINQSNNNTTQKISSRHTMMSNYLPISTVLNKENNIISPHTIHQ